MVALLKNFESSSSSIRSAGLRAQGFSSVEAFLRSNQLQEEELLSERKSHNGFGLINIRNRAKKIGASLNIRTNVGRGTAIVVRLSINA